MQHGTDLLQLSLSVSHHTVQNTTSASPSSESHVLSQCTMSLVQRSVSTALSHFKDYCAFVLTLWFMVELGI